MKLVASIGLSAVLTACGSGGLDGTGTKYSDSTTNNSILGAVLTTQQFTYYSNSTTNNPVSFIHVHDLDGDGVEEVLFAAFQSQPTSLISYNNTSVHIFGWKQGAFQDITSQWLPNGSNKVQGIGDVCFGDFNGDGRVDVFLSAYTDMPLYVNAHVLINQGKHFVKEVLSPQIWQHGVACGDINGDGFDDVVAVGWSSMPTYLGSKSGLNEYSGNIVASGVAIGDFLGDGTKQVVTTDDGQSPYDTVLYKTRVDHSTKMVTFVKSSILPPSAMDIALGKPVSHDIRIRSVDFDNDGRQDVITFGYRYDAMDGDIYRSEIRFHKNLGNLQFVDVTDAIRKGYNTHSMVGYTPQIKDFDGNGRVDIFVSQPDWYSFGHRGTSLLMQNAMGHFVDTEKSTFNRAIASGGGQAALVWGPNRQLFVVKESAWARDGWTTISVQPIYLQP